MKTVCVTGHRPSKFPWAYKSEISYSYQIRLKDSIISLISRGFTHFISGGALGVDLDFAEQVLVLRKTTPLRLEIAVPCLNQDLKWSAENKARYESLLKTADIVTFVSSQKYSYACMQNRNEYMVDKAELVLAVWNGARNGGTYNTICYANKLGKKVELLMLNEIP